MAKKKSSGLVDGDEWERVVRPRRGKTGGRDRNSSLKEKKTEGNQRAPHPRRKRNELLGIPVLWKGPLGARGPLSKGPLESPQVEGCRVHSTELRP
ncbi:hypothetical protein JTE90_005702 [Oedothorax gibbosus]|uniref:Uncharacterized protein n=1 Tax=Oedothorax gibbosus TaxID=931172 RepID=A0AAV6UI72_9ARAC|nr:hypothetical protein JTE90_005702 [Oedothorax gibbosus]